MHLAYLLDCGIVTVRAQGRASVHALARPEATLDPLAAGETLLGLPGDAAVPRPRFGADTKGATA